MISDNSCPNQTPNLPGYRPTMTSSIQFGDARTAGAHRDAPVHLVITSPPYWSIKDYGTHGQVGMGSTYEAYLSDLNRVWTQCYQRLLPGCRMCINVGDQFLRAKDHGRYRVLPIRTDIIQQMAALGNCCTHRSKSGR